MADMLNEQFSSVFSNEDASHISDCPDTSQGFKLENTYFDEETVRKKIKKLKVSGSSRPDEISSKFLSKYAGILSYPLAKMFNLSMESGTVPEDWRKANVAPI